MTISHERLTPSARFGSSTPTLTLQAALLPRLELHIRGLWWPLDWDAQVRSSMTLARALSCRG